MAGPRIRKLGTCVTPWSDTQVIKDAVQLACRAPSLHNSQPWHWVAAGKAVHLFLDKDRVLYSTDHTGREAVIGCGAVLDHFRVAMAAAGWAANVDRYPNPNNSLHLASIDFSPMEFVTEGHRPPRRRNTCCDVPTGFRSRSRRTGTRSSRSCAVAVTSDAVRLDVVADELRAELAEASQLTESSAPLRFVLSL